jgi:hypothetical protein
MRMSYIPCCFNRIMQHHIHGSDNIEVTSKQATGTKHWGRRKQAGNRHTHRSRSKESRQLE